MAVKLLDGHRKHGRWILVPVSDIIVPKNGRICCGMRWWAVTENDEVLFFDRYTSPQCNIHRVVVERLGKGFDAPATRVMFIEMAFLPHSCSDTR